MAKDKDRALNPAAQQRKLEKNAAIKKSKAEQKVRLNERLAKRNPDRLQRQIDDLKALEASGQIKPREKEILAGLERDVRAIRKAREAAGVRAPKFESRPLRQPGEERNRGGGVLGKRRRDDERKDNHKREDSASDTDESVRNIPMPRDTPPPVPREYRRPHPNQSQNHPDSLQTDQAQSQPHALPVKAAQSQTAYSSAPRLRDLKKEAVSRFIPAAVRRKQDAVQGKGGQLLEPEEYDRLEKEGYLKSRTESAEGKAEEARRLRDEEERFARELEVDFQVDERADRGNQDVGIGMAAGGDGKGVMGGGNQPPERRTVEIEEVEDEDVSL